MTGEAASKTLTLTSGGSGAPVSSRGSFLFLVLESHRPLAPPARFALAKLAELSIGRSAARHYESARAKDGAALLRVSVDDPWMSSAHARLSRLLGQWTIDDAGSKNGVRVNGKAVQRAPLADGDLLEIGRTFFVFRMDLAAEPEDAAIFEFPGAPGHPAALATLLPALMRVYTDLATIARSKVSALVEGETGTGKEVIARAIHALSERKGPFVAVNCGAIPGALVEGELFGHRRGAFSDAKEDRPGLVRSADNGTLLLDEIGDLAAPAQAALLRVLQEGEVRPLGATQAIRVDVRFLAATHRPLDQMVEAGAFRADLLNRLAGHRLMLPPLRARREDLGLLLGALIPRLSAETAGSPTLHPDTARALLTYSWPGNVRELEKVLGAAMVLAQGGELKLSHLPPALRSLEPPAAPLPSASPSPSDALHEELVTRLAQHQGNVSAVARAMGKARMQVQRWMKRYGLDPSRFRA